MKGRARDDRHPSATRTTRLEQLRALAAEGNGASEAERANARRKLDEHIAKHGEPQGPATTLSLADILVGGGNLSKRDIRERLDAYHRERIHASSLEDALKQTLQDGIDEMNAAMDAVRVAEPRAGKPGQFVVWFADRDEADKIRCWGEMRIQLPNGEVHELGPSRAYCRNSVCGLLHDQAVGRWGVLYKLKP